MKERVVLDAMFSLSSLNICFRSPGILGKEYPKKYQMRTKQQIEENMKTASYSRKIMYLWCHSAMILYDAVTSNFTGMEKNLIQAYSTLTEVAANRPAILNGKPEEEPHDMFIITSCLLFSIDIGLNNRFSTCSVWTPEFLEEIFSTEAYPKSYTEEWWILKFFVLLCKLQHYYYDQTVPTFEEYKSNIRYTKWKKIYDELTYYGESLPQPLCPYAVIQNTNGSPIKDYHVFNEYGLMANVLYRSTLIWAMHIRPDMTEDERYQVPPGALEHALVVLGLLSSCEMP